MRAHPLPVLAAACLVVLTSTSARAEDDTEPLRPLEAAVPTSSGMQSPAAFGTGVFLSSVGAAGIATGAYLYSGGHGACDAIDHASIPTDAEVGACTSAVIRQVGGIVGLVSGGAFFIAGIPAMAVGASSASPSDEAPSTASATVLVGPARVDLVVTF